MKEQTNGWGASTVATAYVYERIGAILNLSHPTDEDDNIEYYLSRFYDELARNYKVDTGRPIGEEVSEW